MNLRSLFSPVILLLALSGCGHLLHDPSLSQSSPPPPPEPVAALTTQETGAAVTSEAAAGGSDLPVAATAASEKKDITAFDVQALAGIEGQDAMGQEIASAAKKTQARLDEALDLCDASQDFWQKGELENALQALDQAYALILKVDTSDQPKLIQQKEDLRFMISKRILEIYASRNIVVNGNHNAIPLVMNRHIQAEVDLFTSGPEKRFFVDAYRRSGLYRSEIAAAFKEAGLPEELSWLPLIESGFKVRALSRSRALGLWQFIPSTGYKFGLKRDKFIDERMDPVKSTRAAIEYLKELHGIFGDWATVLAAYNCGEGRVLRVIRNQNINYLDNFWDLYERLPRETARYVPRFLATLYILNHPEKYGLDAIKPEPPLQYETVSISKQIHLKNVARAIDVSQTTLVQLNPELRYKIVPEDSYPLRVPPGKGDVLLAAIDTIPVSMPPQRAFVYHRVRSGETLSVIARRYRSTVGGIMRANNLRRSNFIVAGRLLKIPQRGYIYHRPRRVQARNGQAVIHVVKKGDSLWIIARQYGTTTKKIQDLNNLPGTTLHKGQVLTIFAGRQKLPPMDGLKTYVVRSGDSPFIIARRHKMSLSRLLYLNQLWPGSTIYPGQKLYIE